MSIHGPQWLHSRGGGSLAVISKNPAIFSFYSKQIQLHSSILQERILQKNLNITMITLSKNKIQQSQSNSIVCEVCDISLQNEIEKMRLDGFTLLCELAAKNVFCVPSVWYLNKRSFGDRTCRNSPPWTFNSPKVVGDLHHPLFTL